jgi:hypothetical protein
VDTTVTISEFAALCGCSARTIERHVADGRITPVLYGGKGKGHGHRFLPEQVTDYRDVYRWGGKTYEYKGAKKCQDNSEKSLGSPSEATPITYSGTTKTRKKQSDYHFARETLAKRAVASKPSSQMEALPSLADLMS